MIHKKEFENARVLKSAQRRAAVLRDKPEGEEKEKLKELWWAYDIHGQYRNHLAIIVGVNDLC